MADEFADKVQARSPASLDVESVGQARPAGLRGAPEARRGARAGPDRAAAGAPACAPTSTATSRPTGPRPTASRSRCCCACPRRSASASSRCAACRWPSPRTARRSRSTAWPTIEPVFNPEVIRRQNLQRREAIFAGVQGPPAGRRRRRRAEAGQGDHAAAGLQLRHRRPDAASRHEAFDGLLAAMALAVIFIYIVLASQFGSFLQPIAIMASLPLALIGVMLALLFWRSTLERVLDDRPRDADGSGDQERDPAGGLRQPRRARPARRCPRRCCRPA